MQANIICMQAMVICMYNLVVPATLTLIAGHSMSRLLTCWSWQISNRQPKILLVSSWHRAVDHEPITGSVDCNEAHRVYVWPPCPHDESSVSLVSSQWVPRGQQAIFGSVVDRMCYLVAGKHAVFLQPLGSFVCYSGHHLQMTCTTHATTAVNAGEPVMPCLACIV
jgi:hypothetical protein